MRLFTSVLCFSMNSVSLAFFISLCFFPFDSLSLFFPFLFRSLACTRFWSWSTILVRVIRKETWRWVPPDKAVCKRHKQLNESIMSIMRSGDKKASLNAHYLAGAVHFSNIWILFFSSLFVRVRCEIMYNISVTKISKGNVLRYFLLYALISAYINSD